MQANAGRPKCQTHLKLTSGNSVFNHVVNWHQCIFMMSFIRSYNYQKYAAHNCLHEKNYLGSWSKKESNSAWGNALKHYQDERGQSKFHEAAISQIVLWTLTVMQLMMCIQTTSYC